MEGGTDLNCSRIMGTRKGGWGFEVKVFGVRVR